MSLFDPVDYKPVLIVFSHLRWDFVFQRPQQLLTRAAKDFDIIFMEEPLLEGSVGMWRESNPWPGVQLVQPLAPAGTSPQSLLQLQHRIAQVLVARAGVAPVYLWYYTPLAYDFGRSLSADVIIFDKMDELSAFAFAPPGLVESESALMQAADLVFTGGASLHAAALGRAAEVHCFPSSIDALHFGKARAGNMPDPADQVAISGPRIGFFGVIDERIDLALVSETAALRPALQFIMVGPTVKIDPATLPQAPNIHWLGSKSYSELPAYMAQWDLGWMPFALNESTRFISPTKTPEFLAAGLPLMSTAIRDVVEPYGRLRLVTIVSDAATAAAGSDRLLIDASSPQATRSRLAAIDRQLAGNSWDATWAGMRAMIERAASVQPVAVPVTRGLEIANV